MEHRNRNYMIWTSSLDFQTIIDRFIKLYCASNSNFCKERQQCHFVVSKCESHFIDHEMTSCKFPFLHCNEAICCYVWVGFGWMVDPFLDDDNLSY
jgi:hypothetical protein